MKVMPKVDNPGQANVIPFLKALLADESALYINTAGIMSYPLNLTRDSQLHEIDCGMDQIAEYMRQYHIIVSETLNKFMGKTLLNEIQMLSPDARSRVTNLILEHLSIIRLLRENIGNIDDESADIEALDLKINLLRQHQKMVSVLRIYL